MYSVEMGSGGMIYAPGLNEYWFRQLSNIAVITATI
jgi:hypothetical protein